MSETTLYTLWINEANAGPYTLGQLRSMWAGGTISAQTLFWIEGNEDWKPLLEIANQLEQTQPSVRPQPPQKTNNAKSNAVAYLLLFAVLIALAVGGVIYYRQTVNTVNPVNTLKEVLHYMPSKDREKNGDDYEVKKYVDVSYNVEKSDSLVSPYVGTVSFTYMNYFEATFKANGGTLENRKYVVTLAFQDNKWVAKEVSVTLQDSDDIMASQAQQRQWASGNPYGTVLPPYLPQSYSFPFVYPLENNRYIEDYDVVAAVFGRAQ